MAIYIPGALGIPEKGAKYLCIRADGTVTNLHGEPLGVTAIEVKDHRALGDLDAVYEDVSRYVECMTNVGLPVEGADLYAKLTEALDDARIIPVDPTD